MIARKSVILGVAVIAVAALLVAGMAIFMQGGDEIALRPDDTAFVARGNVIYDQHCAVCHGVNLEGQPDWRVRTEDGFLPAPPHDETGHTWHHSDQVLFDVTKYGLARYAGADYATLMPAYEGLLSDEDILAVLSFIKSTWPEDIQALQTERNRAD